MHVSPTVAAISEPATLLMARVGRLLVVPQLILLLYTSLAVAPHQLCLALFVQTFAFVTHNKVITAQYFSWYLCLLPLCRDNFHGGEHHHDRRLPTAVLGLVLAVLVWLATAYGLEMRGMALHSTVWWASVGVFVAKVNLLGALVASTTLAVHVGPQGRPLLQKQHKSD